MKGTKKTFILVMAMMLSLFTLQAKLQAQPYMHSAGIRAGYSSGISYKGFRLHRMSAFEVDFLYNKHGLNLGALYEYHLEPFKKSTRTFIYLGGGAFGGQWDEEFSLGVAAVAG
ncbi:MAG: hypothetical protein KAS29_08380, partial [Bacteroidales bacterium]|nr:hypothetical protein [Bacteroidales bacterium]